MDTKDCPLAENWFTAIHEAGHAVADLRFGMTTERATIVRTDEYLGRVYTHDDGRDLDEEGAAEFVMSYCAGYAALVAAGVAPDDAVRGADGDFEKASELIRKRGLPGDLESWKQRAVEMMSRPENRRAVEVFSRYLVEYRTLDYFVLDVLIELADGNISQAQFDHWYDQVYSRIVQNVSGQAGRQGL